MHVWAFDCHKRMTLNDIERQFTAFIRVIRVLTKRLKLESHGFRLSEIVPHLSTKLKGISSNFEHTFPFACVQS